MARIKGLICCPKCKGDLLASTEERGRPSVPAHYTCPACDLEFPVKDGVADFLPDGKGAKTLAQKIMESKNVVKIYESKWCRASNLFAFFTKIKLDREISLIKTIIDLGPNDTVLDLACGTGIYARAFAEESPEREVIGFDLSRPMLRYGTNKAEHLGIKNITFIHGDAHNLPFWDSSMEAANCCGALHHFSNIRQVMGELYRVVKPGGRFSMAMLLGRSDLCGKLTARLSENVIGVHFFYERELKHLLEACGFKPTVYHAQGIWMIAGGIRRV